MKKNYRLKEVPKGQGPRTTELTDEQRYKLFYSALAGGGSVYWCKLAKITDDRCDGDMEKLWQMILEGAQFTVRDIEADRSYTFKYPAFKRAESAMVQTSEGLRAWADIIEDDADIVTADTYFQFVCFNEVVYG